ncbi:hypothetical protein [Nocardiopsis sp. M1B1]|uniref:hypothetical protein n=1 Tax=Nocardiopsis sp. M1B1 TaxID=3450454 RepID=UPI0040396050
MRFAPLHHHDPAASPGPTPTGYRVTDAAAGRAARVPAAARGPVEVRRVTGFGE